MLLDSLVETAVSLQERGDALGAEDVAAARLVRVKDDSAAGWTHILLIQLVHKVKCTSSLGGHQLPELYGVRTLLGELELGTFVLLRSHVAPGLHYRNENREV